MRRLRTGLIAAAIALLGSGLCHGQDAPSAREEYPARSVPLFVPFNGGGPMVQSIVAGHTPIGFSALPAALGQIRVGLLRPLAVTSAKRVSLLPDVPTLAEAGVRGQEADTPQGILVPAGTPKPIADLLYRSIAQLVHSPEVREKLRGLGFEPVEMTPVQFEARIRADIPNWARVIHDSHFTAE